MASIPGLIQAYQQLLQSYDGWFSGVLDRYPEAISCRKGCSQCCRGLFDISLLDAWVLQQGFARLPAALRRQVKARCAARLVELQQRWPGLRSPYFLNNLPDEGWTAMPEGDLTPCPLLSAEGLCLVYAHRPLTCRLHGLPQIDQGGEVFDESCCNLNFADRDPFVEPGLRGGFRAGFQQEMALLGALTRELFGRSLRELDTFIPLALLVDYRNVDWRGGGQGQVEQG